MDQRKHQQTRGGQPLLAVDHDVGEGRLRVAHDRAEEVRLSVLADDVDQIVEQPGTVFDLPVVVALVHRDQQVLAVAVEQLGDSPDTALHWLGHSVLQCCCDLFYIRWAHRPPGFGHRTNDRVVRFDQYADAVVSPHEVHHVAVVGFVAHLGYGHAGIGECEDELLLDVGDGGVEHFLPFRLSAADVGASTGALESSSNNFRVVMRWLPPRPNQLDSRSHSFQARPSSISIRSS